jgi:hypothetical protein
MIPEAGALVRINGGTPLEVIADLDARVVFDVTD